jgi:phenylpropionate dioxygenase-like ring-hydroxylating dioxygenase large terminal subunit
MSEKIEFSEIKSYLEQAFWPKTLSSWFYAGNESKYKKGLHPLNIMDKALMVFSNEQGEIIAMHRNCIHMNADLTRGKFENGKIKCPMHGWIYQSNGKCSHAQNTEQLKTYPVHVWLGQVFVFVGDEDSYFPFPKYENLNKDLHMFKGTIKLKTKTDWYLLAGNGFDLHHFHTVHFRKVINEPQIEVIGKARLLTHLVFENTGFHIFDRILRFLYGNIMELHFEVVGGNIVLAISKFSKKHNYMFFCIHPPIEGKMAEVYLLFLKDKGLFKLFDNFSLLLRKVFIHRFFQAELDSINELKLLPHKLSPSDIFLMQYLKTINQMILNK